MPEEARAGHRRNIQLRFALALKCGNVKTVQNRLSINKNRGHRMQKYRNGHLPYHYSFYYVLSARIHAYMTWRVNLHAQQRQQNTRYKNPQLVAQHCFVLSSGSMSFFTLRDKLFAQQKHMLPVEGICCQK